MNDTAAMVSEKEQRWANLGTLPSTNAKIVAGIAIAVLTAFVYLALVLTHHDATLNIAAWDSWLLFVGGFLSITTAQYIGKRMTYQEPSPDSVRAGVTPPAPDPAPAVGTGTTASASPSPVPSLFAPAIPRASERGDD